MSDYVERQTPGKTSSQVQVFHWVLSSWGSISWSQQLGFHGILVFLEKF